MRLDLGCGRKKKQGYKGLDKEALDGVDIVHDMEVFPWPIADNSCDHVTAHHVMEHIKPWLTIDVMNEIWRILRDDMFLDIYVPRAGSTWYYQDPTHINPFIEETFNYFDPSQELYKVYEPSPFDIMRLEGSDLEIRCSMRKVPEE